MQKCHMLASESVSITKQITEQIMYGKFLIANIASSNAM
jgi:hypothetical protein